MLELKNITKTFGSFKALDDLSMTVPKGAVYGLVGPNGAGKSTAIRHMTGVYIPDSGTVTMEGQPVFENPDAKERIGFIPDDIFFFPSATLEDMRAYYRGIYPKFDDALFERLYEIFPLPKKSPIRRFSKGMQKQAAFQLSICTRPELLILDEPVDGLDPVMRRQVWSLILSDVAQRETTVVISSHNLRELEDICDHVGIMDHGKNAFGEEPCGYAGQYGEASNRGRRSGGAGSTPQIRIRSTENPGGSGQCPRGCRPGAKEAACLF